MTRVNQASIEQQNTQIDKPQQHNISPSSNKNTSHKEYKTRDRELNMRKAQQCKTSTKPPQLKTILLEEKKKIQDFRQKVKKTLLEFEGKNKGAVRENPTETSIENDAKIFLEEMKNLLENEPKKNIQEKLNNIQYYLNNKNHLQEFTQQIECSVLQEIAIEGIVQNFNKENNIDLKKTAQAIKCLKARAEDLTQKRNNAIFSISTLLVNFLNKKNNAQEKYNNAETTTNSFSSTNKKKIDFFKIFFKKNQQEYKTEINKLKERKKSLEKELTDLISAQEFYNTANEIFEENNNTLKSCDDERKQLYDKIKNEFEKIKESDVTAIHDAIKKTAIFKPTDTSNFLFGKHDINENNNEIIWYANNKSNIQNMLTHPNNRTTISCIYRNYEIKEIQGLIDKQKVKDFDDLIKKSQEEYQKLSNDANQLKKEYQKKYGEDTRKDIDSLVNEIGTTVAFNTKKQSITAECKKQYREILEPTNQEQEIQEQINDLSNKRNKLFSKER